MRSHICHDGGARPWKRKRRRSTRCNTLQYAHTHSVSSLTLSCALSPSLAQTALFSLSVLFSPFSLPLSVFIRRYSVSLCIREHMYICTNTHTTRTYIMYTDKQLAYMYIYVYIYIHIITYICIRTINWHTHPNQRVSSPSSPSPRSPPPLSQSSTPPRPV